ncbi:hypothetical protein MZK49_27625 [Ensifer sesbaniae]|uniref:hypothetical protein n=1 Tax=Ensifer sesbaniae TaxID=1214071 RepID=UPI0020017A1A|nr:hypothetical protein [Ensifer sesbaniae]
MPSLSRQILIERVLQLWHDGRHDTYAIAVLLEIDEREVCLIIEQSERRAL